MREPDDTLSESETAERPVPLADSREEFLLTALGFAILFGERTIDDD